jgi:predicted transcriptional regulator
MQKTDLMFELSHPARIGILRLAATKPIRHRDVLLGSGLAPSEATRHIQRLMICGVLAKNRAGFFEVTNFGKVIIEQLNTFDFISSNSQYIERHDLASMPFGFDPFRALMSCDRIEGTMEVVNAILRINEKSKQVMNCMLDEFNDSLVAVQAEKLRYGLEINLLLSGRKKIPSEYLDCRMLAIRARAFGSVPFFLIASEIESLICFRTAGGKVDYSVAFCSSEPEFLEWCDAVFGHYWQRGRDVML